jgi:hypothetical protein
MVDNAKEAAHRAASDAEQIAWVDEHDNLLGALVRSDLRERGLIGRGTYIMLFNSAGELCASPNPEQSHLSGVLGRGGGGHGARQ